MGEWSFTYVSYPCPNSDAGLDNPCWHDDVIKWKHFPGYWPFVRGIHRSPVNSPHKGQWRGALIFSLICVWINGWVNNREAGDLRRYRAHYDVSVMDKGAADRIPSYNWPITGHNVTKIIVLLAYSMAYYWWINCSSHKLMRFMYENSIDTCRSSKNISDIGPGIFTNCSDSVSW